MKTLNKEFTLKSIKLSNNKTILCSYQAAINKLYDEDMSEEDKLNIIFQTDIYNLLSERI